MRRRIRICGQRRLFLHWKHETVCSYCGSARMYGYMHWNSSVCVCSDGGYRLLLCRSTHTDAWLDWVQRATADEAEERKRKEAVSALMAEACSWLLTCRRHSQIFSLLDIQQTSATHQPAVHRLLDHVLKQFTHTDHHLRECTTTCLWSGAFYRQSLKLLGSARSGLKSCSGNLAK